MWAGWQEQIETNMHEMNWFKGNWGNLNHYSLSCTPLIPIIFIFIIITAVIVIITVVNFATIIIIVLSSDGSGSKFIFSTLSVV